MIRYIQLSNEKKRDAEVTFKSYNPQAKVKLGLPTGEPIINKKILKSSASHNIQALLARHASLPEEEQYAAVAEDLIQSDPEIDMELTGCFLNDVSRIFVNEHGKPVFKIKQVEKIYTPKGELKEEREPKYNECNIAGESIVQWTGKKMPYAAVYNKLVFSKKYQIKHVNGLTYDFLYNMAKQLADSHCLMMLGGGTSGKEPLILNDGGKPYRAFLEGRIQGDKYCLIMHLSDQELKPIPSE